MAQYVTIPVQVGEGQSALVPGARPVAERYGLGIDAYLLKYADGYAVVMDGVLAAFSSLSRNATFVNADRRHEPISRWQGLRDAVAVALDGIDYEDRQANSDTCAAIAASCAFWACGHGPNQEPSRPEPHDRGLDFVPYEDQFFARAWRLARTRPVLLPLPDSVA